jgi:hypothetical protein
MSLTSIVVTFLKGNELDTKINKEAELRDKKEDVLS